MTKIKLLFTCPHDGTDPTSIIERVEGHLDTAVCKADEGQGFNDQNDTLTKELTVNIYDSVHNLSGKEPYIEIAKFHRKYVDYNRKNECAFEQSSPEAKQTYQEYHNGILQKIEEMLPQNDTSMAFLFDIHGTGKKDHQKVILLRQLLELMKDARLKH
jgi:N-formylglutamate amidohydrolase